MMAAPSKVSLPMTPVRSLPTNTRFLPRTSRFFFRLMICHHFLLPFKSRVTIDAFPEPCCDLRDLSLSLQQHLCKCSVSFPRSHVSPVYLRIVSKCFRTVILASMNLSTQLDMQPSSALDNFPLDDDDILPSKHFGKHFSVYAWTSRGMLDTVMVTERSVEGSQSSWQ